MMSWSKGIYRNELRFIVSRLSADEKGTLPLPCMPVAPSEWEVSMEEWRKVVSL
jgi:hypothetical protein